MKRFAVVGAVALLLTSYLWISPTRAQDITVQATETPVPTSTPFPTPTPVPAASKYPSSMTDHSMSAADGWAIQWHADQWTPQSPEGTGHEDTNSAIKLGYSTDPESMGITLFTTSDEYSESEAHFTYLDTSECLDFEDILIGPSVTLTGTNGEPLFSASAEQSWTVVRQEVDDSIGYFGCIMIQPAVSYLVILGFAPDGATYNDIVAPELKYILSTLTIMNEAGQPEPFVTPTPS
jgi:hypothetical protein